MTETTYIPHEGERVHLTVLAIVEDGRCVVRDDRRIAVSVLTPGGSYVVAVTPAPVPPPTGFGARIRATVTVGAAVAADVRLVRSDADQPSWVVHPDDRNRVSPLWVGDDMLSDVVVLDEGEHR